MNLLETINEYLKRKKEDQENPFFCHQLNADEWLETQEFSGLCLVAIKACWVDRDALAIQEAKRMLTLYAVDDSVFDFKVIDRTETFIRIEAVHKWKEYSWIAYTIGVTINTNNDVCSDRSRICVKSID